MSYVANSNVSNLLGYGLKHTQCSSPMLPLMRCLRKKFVRALVEQQLKIDWGLTNTKLVCLTKKPSDMTLPAFVPRSTQLKLLLLGSGPSVSLIPRDTCWIVAYIASHLVLTSLTNIKVTVSTACLSKINKTELKRMRALLFAKRFCQKEKSIKKVATLSQNFKLWQRKEKRVFSPLGESLAWKSTQLRSFLNSISLKW